MAGELACPSCGGAVSALEGSCPFCRTPLTREGPALQLELGEGDRPEPIALRGIPPPPPPLRPVMLESSAVPRPAGSPPRPVRCPECRTVVAAGTRQCPDCGAALREPRDVEDDRRPPLRRRDAEPHRGGLILILGIVSLVAVFFPVLGLPCGIASWVMAARDLQKMRAFLMDDDGRGVTLTGQVLGILGTVINIFSLLGCLAMLLPILAEELL